MKSLTNPAGSAAAISRAFPRAFQPTSARSRSLEIRRDISQSERDAMDDSDFAGKGDSFPISKPEDVAAAASSLGRAGADNYDADTIKANIIKIAKRKGAEFVAQLPKAWKNGGSAASQDRDSDSDRDDGDDIVGLDTGIVAGGGGSE